MGSDDLFRKRKAKSAKQLRRNRSKKEPYAKVLIVCEGEKTEPNYFLGIKNHYEINTSNIKIVGDGGASPVNIWADAKRLYKEAKDSGDEYDKVYCVFDKDSHAGYYEVCKSINESVPKNVYHCITSVPSFEYWLLLHFVYTDRPYQNLPNNSAANQVLTDLKAHIPNYKKGSDNIFEMLFDQLPNAKSSAKAILATAQRNDTDNPSTNMFELVEFLQKIKKQE